MNANAAKELITNLEEMASKGQVSKRIEQNLKGGLGVCTVYTDLMKHSDQRVSVAGKIVMEYGATIGTHQHTEDSETYTVLAGKVQSNGKIYSPGESMICSKGKSHNCVNLAKCESVLRFVKRK